MPVVIKGDNPIQAIPGVVEATALPANAKTVDGASDYGIGAPAPTDEEMAAGRRELEKNRAQKGQTTAPTEDEDQASWKDMDLDEFIDSTIADALPTILSDLRKNNPTLAGLIPKDVKSLRSRNWERMQKHPKLGLALRAALSEASALQVSDPKAYDTKYGAPAEKKQETSVVSRYDMLAPHERKRFAEQSGMAAIWRDQPDLLQGFVNGPADARYATAVKTLEDRRNAGLLNTNISDALAPTNTAVARTPSATRGYYRDKNGQVTYYDASSGLTVGAGRAKGELADGTRQPEIAADPRVQRELANEMWNTRQLYRLSGLADAEGNLTPEQVQSLAGFHKDMFGTDVSGAIGNDNRLGNVMTQIRKGLETPIPTPAATPAASNAAAVRADDLTATPAVTEPVHPLDRPAVGLPPEMETPPAQAAQATPVPAPAAKPPPVQVSPADSAAAQAKIAEQQAKRRAHAEKILAERARREAKSGANGYVPGSQPQVPGSAVAQAPVAKPASVPGQSRFTEDINREFQKNRDILQARQEQAQREQANRVAAARQNIENDRIAAQQRAEQRYGNVDRLHAAERQADIIQPGVRRQVRRPQELEAQANAMAARVRAKNAVTLANTTINPKTAI
jgi:hypothetical protein